MACGIRQYELLDSMNFWFRVMTALFIFAAPNFMLSWGVKLFTTIGSLVATLGSLGNGQGGRESGPLRTLWSQVSYGISVMAY